MLTATYKGTKGQRKLHSLYANSVYAFVVKIDYVTPQTNAGKRAQDPLIRTSACFEFLSKLYDKKLFYKNKVVVSNV
jgi:hypothetical protein